MHSVGMGPSGDGGYMSRRTEGAVRGRPPKDPGEVRNQQIHVAYTAEEKDLVYKAAAEVGAEAPSTWVRQETLRLAKSVLAGVRRRAAI